MQFVVGGDARAARAEFLAGALVDRYVPAHLAKEQPREQTANRSPDDDGSFSLTSSGVHHDRASLGGGSNPDEFCTNAKPKCSRLGGRDNGCRSDGIVAPIAAVVTYVTAGSIAPIPVIAPGRRTSRFRPHGSTAN